jgi:thiol-disulfide isomerase/thioredoxin
MRLDNKYFVPFIVVAALVTAVLIAYFTVSSQMSLRTSFRHRILVQDTLRHEAFPVLDGSDSLKVTDFNGKYVVLDFWATWSNFSQDSHEQLAQLASANPEDVEVLAAVVEDKRQEVSNYIRLNDFPFRFVNGTAVFNKYRVPGLPTQLVYSPDGELVSIFFGYSDSTQYDSLRTLIRNGE